MTQYSINDDLRSYKEANTHLTKADDPSKASVSSVPSSYSLASTPASGLLSKQQQREADYSLYSKRPHGESQVVMSLGSDKESVFFQAYISKLF
jgi:hypothetical protein